MIHGNFHAAARILHSVKLIGRPIAEPRIEPQKQGDIHIEVSAVSTTDGLDHADLRLHGGEILGLAGVSGNGQTALANLLSGLTHPTNGSLLIFGEDVKASQT